MQSKVSPIRSRQASPLRNSALASIPAELARAVVISGLASHAAVQRMPRKRPLPASDSASSTGSTRSPSIRSALPTMAAATAVSLPAFAALAAAIPPRTPPPLPIAIPPGRRFLILRMAFDEHRLVHPVAGPGVAQQILQQVNVALPLPEVMVRVKDGHVRLNGVLHGQFQPRFPLASSLPFSCRPHLPPPPPGEGEACLEPVEGVRACSDYRLLRKRGPWLKRRRPAPCIIARAARSGIPILQTSEDETWPNQQWPRSRPP